MSKTAILIAGLGFGDEGKGSAVDFFTREFGADLIVRYNSGAQAAHCVVLDDNKTCHVFSQLGAGSFVDGVRTYLSQFMFLDPMALIREDENLQEKGYSSRLPNVYVNSQAPIITPFHQAINRLREKSRGDKRHGSCGVGFGEAVSDSIFHKNLVLKAGDFKNKDKYIRKLQAIQAHKQTMVMGLYYNPKSKFNSDPEVDKLVNIVFDRNSIGLMEDWYDEFVSKANIIVNSAPLFNGNVVFEGAQGVLLDENRGFAPHVTWAQTTFRNARRILKEIKWEGEMKRYGILRSYLTRHGNGPFPTFDKELTECTPDTFNTKNAWQGDFRCGYLDIPLLKLSQQHIGKLDGLFLTHCDVLERREKWPICYGYQTPKYNSLFHIPVDKNGRDQTRFINECKPKYMNVPQEVIPKLLASTFKTELFVKSYGPTFGDKKRLDKPEVPVKVEDTAVASMAVAQ